MISFTEENKKLELCKTIKELDNLLLEIPEGYLLDFVISSLKNSSEKTRKFLLHYLGLKVKNETNDIFYNLVGIILLEKENPTVDYKEVLEILIKEDSRYTLISLLKDYFTEKFYKNHIDFILTYVYLLPKKDIDFLVNFLFSEKLYNEIIILYSKLPKFPWVYFSIKYKDLEMLKFLEKNGEKITDLLFLKIAIIHSSLEILAYILQKEIDASIIEEAIIFVKDIKIYDSIELLEQKLFS